MVQDFCRSVLLANTGVSPNSTLQAHTQLLANNSCAGRAEDLVVQARNIGDYQFARYHRSPSQFPGEQAPVEDLGTAEDLNLAVIGSRTVPRLLLQQIFDVPAILGNQDP